MRRKEATGEWGSDYKAVHELSKTGSLLVHPVYTGHRQRARVCVHVCVCAYVHSFALNLMTNRRSGYYCISFIYNKIEGLRS